ncbi:unnamed protein product [Spirodela intermedia]|uniref:Uncharacterized protein n=1 Tax=Spirodela intermedia TaxID=51605 RepID=A0A7I8IY58_SPIIN|nr:unnamed protein product [Spirodela intermedia]CAA6662925.1 unnamed protein product [Spirodela intermedia]
MRWNELRHWRRGLPPGTMGWPVVGETIEFLRRGPDFMKKQRARWILMNEGKGLVPGYPRAMAVILGEGNVSAVHGPVHRVVRGALMSVIGPAAVRDRLFPPQGGVLHAPSGDPLSPVNLPGTAYRRGLQARKRITSLLRDLIEERRSPSAPKGGGDILSFLLREEERQEEQEVHRTRPKLTDDQTIDLLVTIMYTGFEAVSSTVTMVVKYLHDHPSALQELRNEYSEIGRRKSSPDEALTWEDYTSMSFTRAVILETMRLATIVNGVMRKTTKDIPINGFVIPKGWRILVYVRESNYDSLRYPMSLCFDPGDGRSLENHPYFMAFGCGGRLCLGKELAMVETSLFLYYFLTRYRWEETGGDEIVLFPRVEAPRGLHIRLWTN